MNLKRITAIVLICVTFLLMSAISVSAQENITVLFEGRRIFFDVLPQTINGRTMVPIRGIFETMGAKVVWDNSTQSATCTKGGTTVKMTLDSPIVYVNNQPIKMDISPVMVNDRILAPARYVAESFGYAVEWNENTSTVSIYTPDIEYTEDAPKYITDFSAEYHSENSMYSIFFGFKDENYQYTTYSGTAGISIENENGENVYSKEFAVDETMFGTYTKKLTGDTQYILCKIDIPVSEIKKAKTKNGVFSLNFYNSGISYGTLKDNCYNLPILSGSDLAQFDYPKSFTLTKYLSTGRLYRKTNISSFEITNIELSYSGELIISCKVTGTVEGSDYCSFKAKCYDADGFIIGTGTIQEQVAEREAFRFTSSFRIPSETVRIEFVDE